MGWSAKGFTGCWVNMVDRFFCCKCWSLSFVRFLPYPTHSGMSVGLWHKYRNELLRDVVCQVNSAQLPCGLALYPFLSLLFHSTFLLNTGRCCSSELWVQDSASIHLSEENKLTPKCSSRADWNSKTHKEIALLPLLWGLSSLSLSQGGWTPSATSLLRHEDLEIWKRSGVVWKKMDLCSNPWSLWYAHCCVITKDLHRIYIFLRGRSVEREQSVAMTDESIWWQRLLLSHK